MSASRVRPDALSPGLRGCSSGYAGWKP